MSKQETLGAGITCPSCNGALILTKDKDYYKRYKCVECNKKWAIIEDDNKQS